MRPSAPGTRPTMTWREFPCFHADLPGFGFAFCPPRSTRAKAQHACVLRPPERGGAGCQFLIKTPMTGTPSSTWADEAPYAVYPMRIAVKFHIIVHQRNSLPKAGKNRWPTINGRHLTMNMVDKRQCHATDLHCSGGSGGGGGGPRTSASAERRPAHYSTVRASDL